MFRSFLRGKIIFDSDINSTKKNYCIFNGWLFSIVCFFAEWKNSDLWAQWFNPFHYFFGQPIRLSYIQFIINFYVSCKNREPGVFVIVYKMPHFRVETAALLERHKINLMIVIHWTKCSCSLLSSHLNKIMHFNYTRHLHYNIFTRHWLWTVWRKTKCIEAPSLY